LGHLSEILPIDSRILKSRYVHNITVDFKSNASGKGGFNMSSTVVRNFDTWKKFLGERVLQAQKMGMSEDTISKLAYEIGDFLDEKVDPQNAANRTLKELWDVGNKEERQTIARLMVKLTKKNA
jgi:hypothetical protein